MSKINVLAPAVANLIAAGEVVERPASVVKELIENCIDAGATAISVEVRDGGSYISVSDNGSGMDKEDVLLAFLPHATSKISNGNDLFGIKTLGFRGEALASIAAVSKINVLTKQKEAAIGYSADINIERGMVIEKGSPDGTIITVTDLFYNVPARKKFLSKPSIEESAISDIVSRMLIANNSVSIKYRLNGRVLFQSDGNGLNDALYAVYGSDYLDKTQDIACTMPDITLYGRINKQGIFKSNRTYQNLFVNNRLVISPLISKAVGEAYGTLMSRQYPFYTLFLTVPYTDVDVNVHPAKTEVRFIDPSKIYNSVTRAINIALKSDMDAVKIDSKSISEKPRTVLTNNLFTHEEDLTNSVIFGQRMERMPLKEDSGIFSKLLRETQKTYDSPNNNAFKQDYNIDDNNNYQNNNLISAQKTCNSLPENAQNSISLCPAQLEENPDYKIVGTIFDTYIIIEYGADFLLIDQHAAHERILFDLYNEQILSISVKTQPLLLPYRFEVNSAENLIILNLQEELLAMGFEISEFGHNCYRITGVPDLFVDINIATFVREILAEAGTSKKTAAALLKNKIAQIACKTAIKAGTQLTNKDISWLLKQILRSNTLTVCPHGRPFAVKISRREIEKWFRRVV